MASEALTRYLTAGGARVYRVPLRAFPELIAYAYLVLDEGYAALIDTGSGSAASDADLAAAMAALRAHWGEQIDWPDIRRIILTHGHIDHYGGVAALRARCDAPIAIHPADQQPLHSPAAYREAAIAAREAFLRWAGMDAPTIAAIQAFFAESAVTLEAAAPATLLEHGQLLDGRFEIIHTPGHSPGQVCLRLHDMLFTGDHLLATTNPRLTPAHLEPGSGLDAYLHALDAVAHLPGIRLGLAGHEGLIEDVAARARAICASHLARLGQIRDCCRTPQTVCSIGDALYPSMRRPIERFQIAQMVAARVEYLVLQGELRTLNDGGATPRFQHGA